MKIKKIQRPPTYDLSFEPPWCCNKLECHRGKFCLREEGVYLLSVDTMSYAHHSAMVPITHCPFCGTPFEIE